MSVRIGMGVGSREWLGLAGWLTASAGVWFGLIQPSLSLYAQHEEARLTAERAEQQLGAERARFDKVQQQIAQDEARLKELGGSPPPAEEQELQVARITALAKACRLTVDQYLPIGSIEEEDHRAVFLQFSARGEFGAVQDFFRKIESQIEFVDVTHFVMNSATRDNQLQCQVSWSCRINGMRSDRQARLDVPAGPTPPAAEVVLREP